MDEWLDIVEGCLSPENLTCDGELPQSAVRAKSRELQEALRYLQSLKGVIPLPQKPSNHWFDLPQKKVGDQVNVRGTIYTIERVKQVYYIGVRADGRRYNLRIAAVDQFPTIGQATVTPKAEAVPTKLPGQTIRFKGVDYVIEKILKVNYVVRHPNGKQYKLKFGAGE